MFSNKIAPTPMTTESPLRIGAGKALALFIFCWIFAWALGLVAIGLIGGASIERLRWAIVMQDLIIFMLPVAITAMIAAWHPWRFIGIAAKPGWFGVVSTIFTLLIAIPAMNCVVAWNNDIHFPESLAQLESVLRTYEATASAMIDGLLGDGTITDLIVSVLVIGILTGIAEEWFFRGGLQSILLRKFGNPHVAIWVTAIVFSAIHMQFFGFFPRMLLGAFFGYLYWWSGSLWLAVIAHAFNNSLVVLDMWLTRKGVEMMSLNDIGSAEGWGHATLAVISAVLAFISVWYMWRHLPRFAHDSKTTDN